MQLYLACSPPQRELATLISKCLERCFQALILLDVFPPGGILEAVDAAPNDAPVLLLLGPEGVPTHFCRDDWEPLLQARHPRFATLLTAPCQYPKLLERGPGKFWRWDGVNTLRALQEWLLAPEDRPAFRLARVDGFNGRDAELEELHQLLIDQPGRAAIINPWPGSGKTTLAQHFARLAEVYFRHIVWLDCAGRQPLYPLDPASRTLLVLDDVNSNLQPLPGGLTSILATSRRPLPGWPQILLESGDYPSGATLNSGRRNLYSAAIHGRQGGIPLDADATLFRAAASPPLSAIPGAITAALLQHFRPELLAEAEDALAWAIEEDEALANRLIRKVFSSLKSANRQPEALHLLEDFRHHHALREYCENELSWVREDGKPVGHVDGQQLGLFA